MNFLSPALFALSASLDALIVGISFGIRRTRIPLRANLLISLVTLAGTVLSICLGRILNPLFPDRLAKIAGSAVLIAMGSWELFQFMRQTLTKFLQGNKTAESDRSRIRSAKESAPVPSPAGKPEDTLPLARPREILALGAALSLNNIGIGISASIAGLSLPAAALLTLFCSIFLLGLGNCLGRSRALRFAARFADPLSGLMLIALGILELS